MNCTDVAAILDNHGLGRLSTAERCTFDEHVTGCEPCALAWHAQSALLALRVPKAPKTLLETVLRAASSRTEPMPRRARRRVVLVGAALAAGAVLAAATALRLLDRNAEPLARSDLSDPAAVGQTSGAPAESRPNSAAADGTAAPVDVQYVDIDYFLAQRTPPIYPPEALAHKLEGDVTLRFTIDEHGAAKDIEVVRSSDSLFEPAAIASLSQWKYLPRVSAGKRVAVSGVETTIRWTLSVPAAGSPAAKRAGRIPTPDEPRYADFQGVERGVAIAWQRIVADDLRGAELELDELRATYDLNEYQLNEIWVFYGYVYTQYADYGRAIDAYERAVAANEGGWEGQWTALAKLYFARNQYDMALRTLLAYKRHANNRIGSEAAAMIETMRRLGVTEETL
jgi:protein TonB